MKTPQINNTNPNPEAMIKTVVLVLLIKSFCRNIWFTLVICFCAFFGNEDGKEFSIAMILAPSMKYTKVTIEEITIYIKAETINNAFFLFF